jgi:hypothetical protein
MSHEGMIHDPLFFYFVVLGMNPRQVLYYLSHTPAQPVPSVSDFSLVPMLWASLYCLGNMEPCGNRTGAYVSLTAGTTWSVPGLPQNSVTRLHGGQGLWLS